VNVREMVERVIKGEQPSQVIKEAKQYYDGEASTDDLDAVKKDIKYGSSALDAIEDRVIDSTISLAAALDLGTVFKVDADKIRRMYRKLKKYGYVK